MELKRQLDEANSIINAIRNGEVDAFFIPEDESGKVYVLGGADHVYRRLVEDMQEGCLTVALDGTILFCNENFAEIINIPLPYLIGQSIHQYLSPSDQEFVNALLYTTQDHFKTELLLNTRNGINVPVLISASLCQVDREAIISMVVTDLSNRG